MSVIYSEADGDLSVLRDKRVAIIGYGNLGQPIALNLRDSGIPILVGVNDEPAYQRAIADNITTTSIEEAVTRSNVMMMMIRDEVMPTVYIEKVSPHIKKGDTLIFASAYNVAFGYIEPPPFIDVGVIAPRTFGEAVRERYLDGQGFFSFVAAGQDSSGQVWQTILALAKAIGSLKAGAVEITLEQEAELDLFIQQAILPAMHHIMTTAANLLLEMGYPPEAAMMDLYISGEFNDYMGRASQAGLLHAMRLSSLTGQYGIFSRLERFKDLKLDRLMEVTLDEIRNGRFSEEWAREYAEGYPRLRKLLKQQERMDLWELEQQTIDYIRDNQDD